MGNFIFVVPVVAVIAIAVAGVLSYTSTSSGMLVVEAQAVQGGTTVSLSVSATISGTARTTPFNLTLTPGTYQVEYGSVKWYATPPAKYVTVTGGRVAFAVGSYVPVPVEISITQSGPNTTSAIVEHNVTPVVWVNRTGQTIQLESSLFSREIPAGGNYTSTFKNPGTVTFTISPGGSQVAVTVE